MNDLAEFLLARIAEDERAARDVRPGPRTVRTNAPDVERYLTVWHPDRALAECEAKRRIVESRAAISLPSKDIHDEVQHQREYVWRLLALPYANHPDYRSDWRP